MSKEKNIIEPTVEESKMFGRVYKPSDCRSQMLHNLEFGLSKGTTTYIPEVDQNYTWRRQESTILTGYQGEGKSLWFKQLAMIKALEDRWKFVFNSPEDFPAEAFFDDMVHTISGKTTDKTKGYDRLIKTSEYEYIVDNFLEPYFDFIHLEPKENTVENWLSDCQILQDITPRDVFIGDPLMKFKRSEETRDLRDDQYAAFVDGLITEFSRVNDCIVTIVMHQLTPTIDDKTKRWYRPSSFRIKGGGSWADGIDNVLFVWRPDNAVDKISPRVIIGSEKIKKHKLNAVPGEYEFTFNRRTNRYCYINQQDPYVDHNNQGTPGESLYNFDKWLPKH